MAGSPKALTPLTSRRPRRCWTSWRNASQIDTPARASGTVPPVRQSVALLPEKSLRACAGPRSLERQGRLLRVVAGPRVVMAQSGVQANGPAKQPLPLADLLADLLVSLPQISHVRRGFLEC